MVAAVVGIDIGGDLLVEEHLLGQRRQATFDIAAGGGVVAGVDIAEVALFLDKEVFVGQDYECAVDRLIAVRVVLHGLADDIGDLVEFAVVDFVERMQDAALHGFESVVDVRDSALLDVVGGVL